MNIEEAIKSVEEVKKEYATMDGLKDYVIAIETLLTAYEKEKEIVDKINKLNIPVDTLIAEFERLEDLEDDLTTVYLNGVYDGEKKVEDKIKAKIEELEKDFKEYENGQEWEIQDEIRGQIDVLQSPLEKE